MFTTYVVVTLMAIAANTFAATADFMRFNFVLITAAKVGVPESWVPKLGTRSRPRPVLRRCHHHPPARTRLLDRPGGRVPPVGCGRAGVGSCLVKSPEFD
jgi:hypothetical protein